MSWHDPLPVFALLSLLATAWLVYAAKYQRRDPGELQIFLLSLTFGGSWGSLAGLIILAVGK